MGHIAVLWCDRPVTSPTQLSRLGVLQSPNAPSALRSGRFAVAGPPHPPAACQANVGRGSGVPHPDGHPHGGGDAQGAQCAVVFAQQSSVLPLLPIYFFTIFTIISNANPINTNQAYPAFMGIPKMGGQWNPPILLAGGGRGGGAPFSPPWASEGEVDPPPTHSGSAQRPSSVRD